MRLVLFAAVLLVLGCRISRRGACATVPGYLDFDNLPDTNFSCEGKVIGGYYADVETGCQMFHVCTIGQKGEITDIKFLCLNGTVFDQETRVCERVDEVDCSKTEGFYGLNLELYGNTGATYGLEEPEEAEHEESQSHHSQTPSSSAPTLTTSSLPPTPKSTQASTTPAPTIPTTPVPPPSTTPSQSFSPPTTISTVSSTVHSYNQKPHTVHFQSTSSPHSVSSSFLSFPSAGEHLFETAPEGSGNHSPELDHFPPPPSSSSSSWPQVNLQTGGGSGIIHQTDTSPFHSQKSTPKPINLFGPGHTNGHTNHQFIFSTTKAPSHFFSTKGPTGFSVTSHPPVTQFPLKNPGHLVQTNIPPDFYQEQNRNRQQQKPSQAFLRHQSNIQLNPIHFQYSGRPSQQHQVFTTPSVQSTVVSSTRSVTSVKTTVKQPDSPQNEDNPPENVNTFAFGINSGLSPTFIDDKPVQNGTKNPTPPPSYDEYHERDVALDPFFKDVPRISLKQSRNKRKKRQITETVYPSRGSRRFRNKTELQHDDQPLALEIESTTLQRRQPQHPPSPTRNLAATTPRHIIDSSQEPNLQYSTTEKSRRISSNPRSSPKIQTSQRSRVRDSATLESQIQNSRLNENKQRPVSNSRLHNVEQQATETPNLPITTTTTTASTTTVLPETSFSCDNKVIGGYYADPEVDCQLFHICVLGRHGKIRDDKFLCGPGTRFDQKSRTCQAKHLVNCNLATSLYYVNLPYSFPEDLEPVPDDKFESHKVSKRETKKGNSHFELEDEDRTPNTKFSCNNKPQEGLYADVETQCKYFHLCQKNAKGHLHLVSTFECPPGTSFNQPEGNCDSSSEIDCALYSQPEHSFARSNPRKIRNTVDSSIKEFKTTQHNINRFKRDVEAEPPKTDFSCDDQHQEGLYADIETNCKYFHLCQKSKKGHLRLVSSFTCPPGTSFNQREGNCDNSKEIDCILFSQPEHTFARSSRNKRSMIIGLPNKEDKRKITQNLDAPATEFSCKEKLVEGLYADVETNCEYFHLCKRNKKGSLDLVSSFRCPSGTLFNQRESNCDSSHEVDCIIYSQPEHTFAKSNARNKRNALQKSVLGNEFNHIALAARQRRNAQESSSSYEESQISEEIDEEATDSEFDNVSTEDIDKESLSHREKNSPTQTNEEFVTNARKIQLKSSVETNYKNDNGEYSKERGNFQEESSKNIPNESNKKEDGSKISKENLNRQTQMDIQEYKKGDYKNMEDHSEEVPLDASLEDETDEEYELSNESVSVDQESNSKLIVDSNHFANEGGHDINNKNQTVHSYEKVKESSNLNKEVVFENSQGENVKSQTKQIEFDTVKKYDNFTKKEANLTKDGSKSEDKHQKSENAFKLKVNELLMKLNASVEVQSEEVNVSNEDYYDYYADDVSLLELEELKDKIVSGGTPSKTDNNGTNPLHPGNLQQEEDPEVMKTSSKRVNLSIELENSENQQHLKNDSNETHSLSNKVIRNSSEDESNIAVSTMEPERTTISGTDQPTTDNGIGNQWNTEKLVDKTLIPSTDIPEDFKTTFEDREISTNYQDTTEFTTTAIENYKISSEHVDTKAMESEKEEKSTSALVINSYNNDELTSTTDILTTHSQITSTPTSPIPSTTSNLLHPYKSRPVYRTWRTTIPPLPVSIRPNSSIRHPRPRIKQGTKKGNTKENSVIHQERESSSTEKTNEALGQEKHEEQSLELNAKNKLIEYSEHRFSKVSKTEVIDQEQLIPDNNKHKTEHTTGTTLPYFTSTTRNPTIPSKLDHNPNLFSGEYRIKQDDGMTPSSVLPTFSRKQFFIDRDIKTSTESLTTIYQMTTLEMETATENISDTEGTTEESYFFTSVEAQTPKSSDIINKENIGGTFTCSGKDLHQYLPDPLDCHLFHYCSPGFHSRQLLDFRFMCDKGTAFSPITHRCENEDESLCGNLHN